MSVWCLMSWQHTKAYVWTTFRGWNWNGRQWTHNLLISSPQPSLLHGIWATLKIFSIDGLMMSRGLVCRMGLAISFASTVKEKVCVVFLCILLRLPLRSVFSLESNYFFRCCFFVLGNRDLRLDLDFTSATCTHLYKTVCIFNPWTLCCWALWISLTHRGPYWIFCITSVRKCRLSH